MAGRKKDSVWNYFHEIQTKSGKGLHAKCKLCNKEIQGIVSRMKFHHANCKEGTEFTEMVDSNCQPSCSSEDSNKKRSSEVIGFHTSKKLKIDSFVVKTAPEQRKELDLQVARTIYAINAPFQSVENHNFRKLIEKLRPGYTPPNKHAIGSYLLNDVYEEEIKKCAKLLKNEVVSMSLDGWSNVHKEPIISCSITTKEGNVYLIDTFDTSGNSHTSEYLHEICKQSIIRAKSDFQCQVKSIVTDNASNMSKMRNIFKVGEKTGFIITYGCSAHILNLLAKDLQLSNVTEHVVQIVKYFRNHDFVRAAYKQAGGLSLVLPQEVRWNTMCDCLASYLKNWPILLTVAEENDQIDSKIKAKILNVVIKRSAEDMLKTLQPIAKALDYIQKNSCSISEAVVQWKLLELELKNVLEEKQMFLFMKRYEQALTPAHFLAFLLNVNLKNEHNTISVNQKEKEAAIDFAKEHYGNDFLFLLMKLLSNSPPFIGTVMDSSILKNLTALEWWISFAAIKECVHEKELNTIKQLLIASASSSGIERIFSSFNLVHSKLRNRLGVEKASKLVFLFKALNVKCKESTE